MSVEMQGAAAVVTGAGSGIGRAAAHSLARRGALVVVTDRDAARADTVAGELGGQAVAARCDVTSLDDLEAVRDLALTTYGRVDIVMNNAGVLAVGPVEAIPLDAWRKVIDVNLLGVVRSNLVFLPHLLERGSGHIVNTASNAGLMPYGYEQLPYTASKHAVVGLSESLALYLRPRGIGVSCLCPGMVVTNIAEQVAFYGEVSAPRGPNTPVLEADQVGELVADGIAEDRFLILTVPAVADELREKGADIEAYLARLTSEIEGT
ncbi:SDR family oxidoreductase [Streptomyces acidiscabies]|uniref:SDR family oxidoreductase n=1 Tax=Streptomyces acidiscabies TaxID=42234 RepID=UPI0009608B11|nr:SDR family oxidoreductase [Streptomyces acidiscabies]GAV38990.1 1-deoxy-11-beta-hydroxypentalenate [Streptomyces acidiscabies]